ncbi:MAG: hypothetical protein JXQ87_03435 [Bacteroidia bacterium]
MFKKGINRLKRNLVNLPAKKITKKIVVFESDDWGAIRMPSQVVHSKLVKKGIIQEKEPFSRLDGLESSDDLELLFDVLSSVKDSNGNNAILTADTIMANPNFDAIKDSEFESYAYEKVTDTMNHYDGSTKAFDLWIAGKNSGIFKPQLHGREHVNVKIWMEKLRKKEDAYAYAFDLCTYAINGKIAAAFNAESFDQESSFLQIIKEAQNIFTEYFGHHSSTFIAPNYTWSNNTEGFLHKNKVLLLQGSRKQNVPDLKGGINQKLHFTGQKNNLGQFYSVRNCLFEPSLSPKADYVSACLRNISNAFFWNTPAIIGTHRINYVSRNGVKERDKNLANLKKLLDSIAKEWPDVIFMSSDDLLKELAVAK